jgi:hypothetical protein
MRVLSLPKVIFSRIILTNLRVVVYKRMLIRIPPFHSLMQLSDPALIRAWIGKEAIPTRGGYGPWQPCKMRTSTEMGRRERLSRCDLASDCSVWDGAREAHVNPDARVLRGGEVLGKILSQKDRLREEGREEGGRKQETKYDLEYDLKTKRASSNSRHDSK